MSQKKRALRYFQTHKKGMTPLDMWVKLGIYRAADVIYQLRQEGYDFKTDYVNVPNKYGEFCRVAYYTLED